MQFSRVAILTTFLISAPLLAVMDVAGWRDRLRETDEAPRRARSVAFHPNPNESEGDIAGRDGVPARPIHQSENKTPPPGIAGEDFAATPSMERIKHRLQTLGAAYMRLDVVDTHHGEGPSFWFVCDMPEKGRSPGNGRFEAAGPAPEAAMRQVLENVESWRTSQDTPGQEVAKGASSGHNK